MKAPRGGMRINGRSYPSGSEVPERYRKQLEGSSRPHDPGQGVKDAPPNLGRTAAPHVITFRGIQTTLSRTYRPSDEALRHSVENAHMMLNDPMVEGPLLARQQMTALLNWSIESEDDKNPILKGLVKELTDIVNRTPRFAEYRRCLLEAVWYGRYGIQNAYGFHVDRKGVRRRVIRKWVPVSGDKILFRFDDGSGDYDPEQIGFRVSAALAKNDLIAGPRELESTADGLAYFLQPWERKMTAIHKHMIRDGEFEDPLSGSQVHGVGLRHFLYWVWYQKQEAMAQVAEIVERTGMGFTVYFYPSGNAQARDEVEKISQEQAHTNVILMPSEEGDHYRIEQIPPNTQGLQALTDFIETYLGDWIVRFILGQTLSMKPDATGMNTGVADLQKDTLSHIVRYDAVNLEETLTREFLLPLRDYNFPKYRNVDFTFKISTKVAAPQEELAAIQSLWQMGAEIKVGDIFDRLDLSVPDKDDKTLFNPQIVQQIQALEDAKEQGVPATELVAGDKGEHEEEEVPEPDEPTQDEPEDPPPTPDAQQLNEDEEDRKHRIFGPIMYSRRSKDYRERIQRAVQATDPNPSEGQREAGNYRKGKVNLHGMTIAIETPKGKRRRPEWPPMAAHYGEILRNPSDADGDNVDVFIGPHPESEAVFVVDQVDSDGKFDEAKVIIGVYSTEDARKLYLDNYTRGWRCGPITPMTMSQFRAWLEHGDTGKPLHKQVSRYRKDSEPIRYFREMDLANLTERLWLKDYAGYRDEIMHSNLSDREKRMLLERIPGTVHYDKDDPVEKPVSPIFDGEELKPEIRDRLVKIAQDFLKGTEIPVEALQDVVVTGSLASGNWTSRSDLDLHLVVDPLYVPCDAEMFDDYLREASSNWNAKTNVTILGHKVEIFVEQEQPEALVVGA